MVLCSHTISQVNRNEKECLDINERTIRQYVLVHRRYWLHLVAAAGLWFEPDLK